MKVDKDVLMKVGIAAAIVLIVYLVYRSRSCKDTYAQFVADDQYSENMFEESPADLAEGEYGDDYAEEDYGGGPIENFTLMESTLDDDQANAVFEPEM